MFRNSVLKSRVQPSWEQREPIQSNPSSDPLEVIYLEGQWRLNAVSPLYDFQYEPVKLKQYSSKIRQSVVSTVTASSTIKYVVQLEEMSGLKYSDDEPNAVMLTINSTQESTSKTKAVYTAILLSWGVNAKLRGAVHLPYLIERGEQKLSTAVKTTLQTVFDCNIDQINLTQSQLLQLGFNCLELDSSPDLSQFVLSYKTPRADVKDKLTIGFCLRDMRLIWNGAKEEVSSNSELVNLAYKMLQNQIYHIASLDLSFLELCEVLLPRAEFRSNGMIKMKTPEFVNLVFTFLNKLCNLNQTLSL